MCGAHYLCMTFSVCSPIRMRYTPAGRVRRSFVSVACEWESRWPTVSYTFALAECKKGEPCRVKGSHFIVMTCMGGLLLNLEGYQAYADDVDAGGYLQFEAVGTGHMVGQFHTASIVDRHVVALGEA